MIYTKICLVSPECPQPRIASHVRIVALNHYLFIHVAAGYNNVEVAEFLLENEADVNAQDKGGLIPLHNASSYGVCMFVL